MKHNILLILVFALFAISCNNNNSEQQAQAKNAELVKETNKVDSDNTNNNLSSDSKDEKLGNSNNIDNLSENKKIANQNNNKKYPIITFIELGSVNCIPCKKMQPIMESLEKKYKNQLKVIFYDVWKDEYKNKSKEYGIKLIPTQIFLNSEGKEIHRHEGFYQEEQIDKFLQSNGLRIN